jgi:hypothetical protein
MIITDSGFKGVLVNLDDNFNQVAVGALVKTRQPFSNLLCL